MTPDEFAARWMAPNGPRYRRWSASWEFADCYGGLVLYWREVHGRELLAEPDAASGMADGFAALGLHWAETEARPGACAFMAWDGTLPRHCGVLLPDGTLLHTEAPAPGCAGGPRITPLRAMTRLHPDIRFYTPEPSAFAACRQS